MGGAWREHRSAARLRAGLAVVALTFASAVGVVLGALPASADTTQTMPDDPSVVVACGNWGEQVGGSACLSLQQALDQVLQHNNAQVGTATIVLEPGMYCPIDLTAVGTVYRSIDLVGAGLSATLDASGPVSLSGPEAGLSTFVSHNGDSQCSTSGSAFITVNNGDYGGFGSQHFMLRNIAVDGSGTGTPSTGISASESNLWLRDVLVENVSGTGVQYYSGDATSLSVQESAFVDNATGVQLNGEGSINESTMAANTSVGLYTSGGANLGNNTIADNGVGVNAAGATAVANSIVAGNTTNCSGGGWEATQGVGSSGNNLLGAGCTLGASNGDTLASAETVSWLGGANGALDTGAGPTPVIHPPGQAVGAAVPGWCLETDQRDITGTAGAAACDIGSYNSSANGTPTADTGSIDMGKIHVGDTGYGSANVSAAGAPIYLGDVTLTGPDAASFTTTDNTCSLAALVPHQGSGSCMVSISTTPTAVGPLTATLKIKAAASNTTGGYLDIPITAQGVPPAPSALTVTRFDDPSGDGNCYGQVGDDCSLRQALAGAASGATIQLPAGTYQLTQGSLFVGQNVTIDGAGARTTVIEQTDPVDGNGVLGNDAQTTIAGVTITGGGGQDGGGISNDGDLTLNAVTISGNNVDESGGGIYDRGNSLAIIDSTITGNDVTGDQAAGGGLFTQYDDDVTIVQSTIAGNTVSGDQSQGGGIYAQQGSLDLSFATIANNTAHDGGGIYSLREADCECEVGDGIRLDDTVLATNTGGAHTANCDATEGRIVSHGHNAASDSSCKLTKTGDKQGVAAKLGALGNNGGTTDTMLPGTGSPLINAGSSTAWQAVATELSHADQRGTARPTGSRVDIGAVEAVSQPVQPHATTISVAATPHQINAGKSAKITTTLTDAVTHAAVHGVHVQLQSRVGSSGTFHAVTSPVTTSQGKATVALTPSVSTQYRWTFAGNAGHAAATSHAVGVTVAQVVTAHAVATNVARHHKITIYGTVTPNESGQTVRLQRFVSGHWTNLTAHATVHHQVLPGQHHATIGYVLHAREAAAGTYRFRVVRAATTHNAAGYSPKVVITVH